MVGKLMNLFKNIAEKLLSDEACLRSVYPGATVRKTPIQTMK
ncbi:aspartyl-tRNA synthetase [Oceanobacillus picturae]|uniref:Aspartyl-tRNA synthetase n=1 Tax=Oceanobacillus picturae TaxID=171693 RepID=A0A0U9H612_9BACI|nr:aspartyl-tRNA synthetase [Oceanobacillus picturae]